ncbi:hypothetical protein HYH03_013807 [Edaphochlamys debaryana]|uniref:Uncharacterized protein n=1 Tax=Edaphochlamys debaryana TaxID=47281 RepID=A0A836BSI5_9CHLO|nr:hypothetical protein HYH03_013807 [Edaphochlamys debaryana]|eukprot:KAG2487526.1 hypothetical protein HYH03_013807 [Edaphochlamys debaryana]
MVRLKNRYLLVEVAWRDGKVDDSFGDTALLQAIREGVAVNFGDFGAGTNLASLAVRYYSPYTETAIVRCATAELERIMTSLALTTELKQRGAQLRVLQVAGTLAGVKRAALEHSCGRLAAGTSRLGRQHLASAEALHRQLPALEL